MRNQPDDDGARSIPVGEPAHDYLDGCYPPLRDLFAGFALAGLAVVYQVEGKPTLVDSDWAAEKAYEKADAMLIQREKVKP